MPPKTIPGFMCIIFVESLPEQNGAILLKTKRMAYIVVGHFPCLFLPLFTKLSD
jgi:hypothetical protein